MTKQAPAEAQFIAPDAYPQMMSKQAAANAMKVLRSAQTAVKAQVAIEAHVPPMRAAILQYVQELEDASGDLRAVFDKAQEIRGFAETAGMLSTGRIADGLCRYFEECEQSSLVPDGAVVNLHVSAISRTARDPDSLSQMSDVVAKELAMLAGRKLAESRKAPKNS